jgi:hypothetical protein
MTFRGLRAEDPETVLDDNPGGRDLRQDREYGGNMMAGDGVIASDRQIGG